MPGSTPDPTDAEAEQEPDYRFTLANERTFLAWIRTALALLAGGIAVVALVPEFGFTGARQALGTLLTLLSISVAVAATRHWRIVQRAMRQGRELPRSRLPVLLTAGLTVLSILIVLLILIPHGR